ncbi:hypothetical protein AB3Y40_14225 [Yoonia sp. R2331]|uniref:hypothetical protein n=1 Tax=Yoonia sp. R2331 TaxID=3237238 RepID=UPI0034E47316
MTLNAIVNISVPIVLVVFIAWAIHTIRRKENARKRLGHQPHSPSAGYDRIAATKAKLKGQDYGGSGGAGA